MNIGGAYAQDAAAGQKVFRKCLSCHTLEPGKHKSGPSLHGIVGSTAGTKDGFKRYSSPLKAAGAAGLVWDEELLAAYLPDPNKFIAKYNSENNVKAKAVPACPSSCRTSRSART